MAPRKNRYRNLEQIMTILLIISALLFIAFLIAAAKGFAWLKAASAIIAILLSILSLGFLYLTKELLRPRSLWMTAGFSAIVICILVSLLCDYPSPSQIINTAKDIPGAVGVILLP